MVEIPPALRTLTTATVRERDGEYVFSVPADQIERDAVEPGTSYQVGVLSVADDATETAIATPPVTEGEVRDVTIEAVGDQGDGIAKVERGYVVIVPEGEPGDEVTVEIEEVKQNVAFARSQPADPDLGD